MHDVFKNIAVFTDLTITYFYAAETGRAQVRVLMCVVLVLGAAVLNLRGNSLCHNLTSYNLERQR